MPALPAILLMGPTGAGKTAHAAELVARLPLEIVSVDSAMVFRGMDIGTAKPGPRLLARAPHHLIDLIDPAESYSAARFVADANRVMDEIRARGRVPLLVGGTMLYFRALQSGLAKLPPADAAIRESIERRAGQAGWPALHAELQRLDPAAALRILPGDQQRIQRALEVIELTGSPISSQQREDLRGAVRDADLLVAATTSTKPIVKSEWLKAGVHINAVGSHRPDYREIDGVTLARAKLIVDSREAIMAECGDILLAIKEKTISENHIHGEIGEVLAGTKPGRSSAGEVTLYKSVGIAIQDVATANLVYRKALEQAVGTTVEI